MRHKQSICLAPTLLGFFHEHIFLNSSHARPFILIFLCLMNKSFNALSQYDTSSVIRQNGEAQTEVTRKQSTPNFLKN